MEVIDSRSTLLTNAEVYQLLYQAKGNLRPNTDIGKYGTIVYETLKYFNDTPGGPYTAKESQIIKLINELKQKDFKLFPAELIQIINLKPTQLFEIQLIVEESEERLSEERVKVFYL